VHAVQLLAAGHPAHRRAGRVLGDPGAVQDVDEAARGDVDAAAQQVAAEEGQQDRLGAGRVGVGLVDGHEGLGHEPETSS
jgi:hypothetical protein